MAKPELLELRVHAAADPERLAIACVTFAELDARANRLADVLRARWGCSAATTWRRCRPAACRPRHCPGLPGVRGSA